MKTLLCALMLACIASISMGSSVRFGIDIYQYDPFTIEEAKQLTQIMPQYNDLLTSYIVALKQGMTASYKVQLWLSQDDDPIRSAYVVKPNTENVILKNDRPGHFSYKTDASGEFYSIGDLKSHWPSGDYVFYVTFTDGHIETWTTTVANYDTTLFPDIVTGSLSTDTQGQLLLDWSTVNGISEYAVWAWELKKNTGVYESDTLNLTPHQPVTTQLPGAYTGKGNYNIGVDAYRDVSSGQFSVRFISIANWFSFKNPLPPKVNNIDKCTVTAGKANMDSISFSGTLDAIEADFIIARQQDKNVEVTLNSGLMPSPFLFSFPVNDTNFKKGVYKSSVPVKGGTSSFGFDSKTGKMTFSAKSVDLTGMACPITFTFTLGDYSASVVMTEAVVNGTKPCPSVLMMGVQNDLDVLKFLPKRGKAAGTDSLSAQGTFSVSGEFQFTDPFILTLGGQSFTVAGSAFKPVSGVVSCTNSPAQEDGLVSAKFDTNTGAFTITVKNTTLEDYGIVPFDLSLFGIQLGVIETVNLGDPFVGKRTMILYGNDNIRDGFVLDAVEKVTAAISTSNNTDYVIKAKGISFSMTKETDNLLALNPQPQNQSTWVTPNAYMLSDGINGAFVMLGQENYDPLDISVRVATWTRPAVVTGSQLAGTWNTPTWIFDNDLMDDVLMPFETTDGTFAITDLGNNQVKLDLGGGINWVLDIVGNSLVPTGQLAFLNSRIVHFSMVTDGNGIAMTWIGVDTNDPTIISTRIALAARQR